MVTGYPGFAEGINWDLLVDPTAQVGEERFASQYWRANVYPTERYVLSVKGSTPYRLKPGESGFANLFLAGDWTYNVLNYGCVEAAVISGMMAVRAICTRFGTLAPHEILGERDWQ